MGLKVSEIMKKDVFTLNVNATVGDAMMSMLDKNVDSMPVVDDNGKLVGFLTDGDLMNYLFSAARKNNGFFAENTGELTASELDELVRVKDALSGDPIMPLAKGRVVFVYDDDNYDEACRLLAKKKIKKVAVVDPKKNLVGVLSRSIMLEYLFERAQFADKK